jgi:hypothetical protein
MHYHNVPRGGEATTTPVVIVVILVVIYVGGGENSAREGPFRPFFLSQLTIPLESVDDSP